MSKNSWIIILVVVVLLFCAGVVIAGIIFIPKLISNIPGGNDSNVCEIMNCHGLEMQCGSNPPDMCTEEYKLGDNCRIFATCSNSGGTCSFKPSADFTQCKSCIEECIDTYSGSEEITMQFSCAESCSQLIEDSTK